MAAAGYFVEKVAYLSEMARSAIESDFIKVCVHFWDITSSCPSGRIHQLCLVMLLHFVLQRKTSCVY